ncbi:MAG: phage major tail tube protein [Alphaproteobacteria bacterium]
MKHILRGFNAFVEGVSTHLEIEELTPPLPTDNMEDFVVGGQAVGIPIGHEALEASFKLTSWNTDVMKRMGLAPGVTSRVTFRGQTVSEVDGATQEIVIIIVGRINPNPDSWNAQGKSGIEYSIGSIAYFKHSVDNVVVHEVDVVNMIRIVDGVDQWTDRRSALGLG